MTSRRRRNGQQFRIFWLDRNISSSKDYADFRRQLQATGHQLETFSNPNVCYESLYAVTDGTDRVVLIVSDTLGRDLVPLIDSSPQLYRVYIYSANSSQTESWTNKYEKARGNVYPSIQSICEKLKMEATTSDPELLAISFVSQMEIHADNRQDPSFMYKQLLKDILLNDNLTDPEDISREQMIQFCRQVYQNNTHELAIIDEFEREFFPEHAFYWYTRDCFLYRMLNKALWTPEPITLYKLRYFLRHLHQQVLINAAEQSASASHSKKMKTVYRGQGIRTSDFNAVKNGIGGLLSFDNFLSTTLSRAVADSFAEESKLLADQTSVMFIMNIDSSVRKCPFIEVGQMGYFQNLEQEVLFSMGTVFRIEGVQALHDGQWEVRLVLSEDVDDNLARYTAKMRKKTRSTHPLISLVKLMDEMGQYKMIDPLASLFAENDFILQHSALTGTLQHAMGSAYLSAGNKEKALVFLQNALETYRRDLSEDDPTLSPTYNNIGSVYHAMSDYRNALEYHQKALDCQLDARNPDLDSIATYSTNIASVYQASGDYSEALIHLNKALEIQKQSLGEHHPSLSDTYNAIAVLHDKKKEYKQAGK